MTVLEKYHGIRAQAMARSHRRDFVLFMRARSKRKFPNMFKLWLFIETMSQHYCPMQKFQKKLVEISLTS